MKSTNRLALSSWLSLITIVIALLPLTSCANKKKSVQKQQYTLRISLFSDRLGSSEGNPITIEEYSDSAAFVRANEYYEHFRESMRKTNVEAAEKSYDLSLYPDGFELTDEKGIQVFFPELELLEFKNRREGNLMEQNMAYEDAFFGMSMAEVRSLPHFKSFQTSKTSHSIFNNSEFIRSAEHQSSHYKVELRFDDQDRLSRVVFRGNEDEYNFKPNPLKGSQKHVEGQIHNFRDAIQKKYGPPQYKHEIIQQQGAAPGEPWAYIWNIGLKKITVGAYVESDMYHFCAEISQE